MSVIDLSAVRSGAGRPALSLVPGCGAAFVPHADFWAARAQGPVGPAEGPADGLLGGFVEPGVDLDPSLLAAARGLDRGVVMCLDAGTVAAWVSLLMMEADRITEAQADVMPGSEGEATLIASRARLCALAMLIAQSGCPLDPGPPFDGGGPGGGVPVRRPVLGVAA